MEEVTCHGDLWEMGNEEGLEGGQIGSGKLWKNPERGHQRAGLSCGMPLGRCLAWQVLGGGGGREGSGYFKLEWGSLDW